MLRACGRLAGLGLLLAFLPGCAPSEAELARVQARLAATLRPVEAAQAGALANPVAGGRVYVPVYAEVYHDNGRSTIRLAVTLSVRNTDETRPILVRRIDYYDTAGQRIRQYLSGPAQLGPMATAEFFVAEGDRDGGSGANFIVEWVAGEAVPAPVIESVALGTTGAQGISFVCPGQVVADLASQPAP